MSLPEPIILGDTRLGPPVFLAPMAGITDLPFRRAVARHGGAGLMVSEMVASTEMVTPRPSTRAAVRAKALVEKGAAVVGIDFKEYMKALEADEDECIYMISDIESLSQQIQRTAGTSSYRQPILTGIGKGGTLALAMIAQSPVSTVRDAVAVETPNSSATARSGEPVVVVRCTSAASRIRSTEAPGRPREVVSARAARSAS